MRCVFSLSAGVCVRASVREWDTDWKSAADAPDRRAQSRRGCARSASLHWLRNDGSGLVGGGWKGCHLLFRASESHTHTHPKTDCCCCSPNNGFITRMCVHDPGGSRVTAVRAAPRVPAPRHPVRIRWDALKTHQSSSDKCVAEERFSRNKKSCFDNHMHLFVQSGRSTNIYLSCLNLTVKCGKNKRSRIFTRICTDVLGTHRVRIEDNMQPRYALPVINECLAIIVRWIFINYFGEIFIYIFFNQINLLLRPRCTAAFVKAYF